MQLPAALLGTTVAIVAVGVPLLAADAGEVTAAGFPNIQVEGFVRFRMHGGDINEARLGGGEDGNFSNELDFSNDTEVHVTARASSETTGLEYGASIEFEADTNRNDNTDETFVFLRGGWGEVRLGDEDGPVDASAVGAHTIAAGTGGLDGSIIDTFGGGPTFKLRDTNDATKVRYYSPDFGGFQVAVGYTPQAEAFDDGSDNGDALATTAAEVENFSEAALIYRGVFGGTGVVASLTGATCTWQESNAGTDDDDCFGVYGGANVDLFGFKLGAGLGTEAFGDTERDFFNVGLGALLGPVNVSVNYGQLVDSDNLVVNGAEVGDASNLVLSADVPLVTGLVLAGDVGFFDNDADDAETGDDGWQAVGRIELSF